MSSRFTVGPTEFDICFDRNAEQKDRSRQNKTMEILGPQVQRVETSSFPPFIRFDKHTINSLNNKRLTNASYPRG